MKANVATLVSGLLFGIGLGVAGMTNPSKVVGFLDITGDWDPSLAFVMVGAIGVNALAYLYSRRRGTPILAPKFSLPTRSDIDPRLVGGAALFGAGWGLGGYCPGPGLVSLVSGSASTALFVGTMLVGMWAFSRYDAWTAARR